MKKGIILPVTIFALASFLPFPLSGERQNFKRIISNETEGTSFEIKNNEEYFVSFKDTDREGNLNLVDTVQRVNERKAIINRYTEKNSVNFSGFEEKWEKSEEYLKGIADKLRNLSNNPENIVDYLIPNPNYGGFGKIRLRDPETNIEYTLKGRIPITDNDLKEENYFGGLSLHENIYDGTDINNLKPSDAKHYKILFELGKDLVEIIENQNINKIQEALDASVQE